MVRFIHSKMVEFEFEGEVIEWRGPAPFLFVAVPPKVAAAIRSMSRELSYGWGCIPARVRIGKTEVTTSLFPREGGYLVPIKVALQRAEGVALSDMVALRLSVPG